VNRIFDIMNPTRWAVAGAVLLALLAAIWGIHYYGITKGRAEVRAEWDKAKADAQAIQDAKTDAAVETLVQEVEVIKTVYRDRIKEVKVYVPNPNTVCPADPDFVRLFNAAR